MLEIGKAPVAWLRVAQNQQRMKMACLGEKSKGIKRQTEQPICPNYVQFKGTVNNEAKWRFKLG